MIFKLTLDPTISTIEVVTKNHSYGGHVPVDTTLEKMFKGRKSIYVNGVIDKEGMLKITGEVRASF